jgi:hypothetical protein
LSDEEISELLTKADEIKRWASGIADWALKQATDEGVVFPGWKLVEGRSNRKITDEVVAFSRLEDAGYDVTQITKLRGITDLESIVGKAKLAEILGEYIVKPAGKPALVPESDKRPEYKPEDIFTEVKENDNA